ncbi:MAG: DUF3106 domain-containing protein [Nitrosomonadales bacterium]
MIYLSKSLLTSMNKLIIATAIAYALLAQTAAAAPEPWVTLPPAEREALAPLSPQWNSLPEKQQHNLRILAQHYPKLKMDEKRRFQNRLVTWAQLTPAQRQAAREKYRAFSQIPAEKREQIKQMVKQNQAIKLQLPASSVAPAAVQP